MLRQVLTVEDEVDNLESSELLPMEAQCLEQPLVVVLQVAEVELLNRSLEALISEWNTEGIGRPLVGGAFFTIGCE